MLAIGFRKQIMYFFKDSTLSHKEYTMVKQIC